MHEQTAFCGQRHRVAQDLAPLLPWTTQSAQASDRQVENDAY